MTMISKRPEPHQQADLDPIHVEKNRSERLDSKRKRGMFGAMIALCAGLLLGGTAQAENIRLRIASGHPSANASSRHHLGHPANDRFLPHHHQTNTQHMPTFINLLLQRL